MKMKDVMKATGLQENTIRFYESKNLLSPTKERRNGRTYHEYSLEDVKTLKNILVLRKARFSLEEIRTMQTQPEKIPEITACQAERVAAERRELSQIGDAGQYGGATDIHVLSQMVEADLRRDQNYKPTFHFGAEDPETEEEKQMAIARFKERPPVITKNGVILILSMLSAILLGIVVFLTVKLVRTVPAPSGTTEGWIYYNADGGLMRSREDGSEAAIIFQRTNYAQPLQFAVAEDKVYISHLGRLYSVNADGSDRYRYYPEYYSAYAAMDTSYSAASSMFFYEDSLIMVEHSGGGLGGGSSALVRVKLDGTGEQMLDIDTSGWETFSAQIWGDKLYVLGIYSQKDWEYEDAPTPDTYVYEYEEEPELIIYDMSTNRVEYQEEWLSYRDFGATCNLEPIYQDETGMYLSTFDGQNPQAEELGSDLVRVTPECLEGTVIAHFPGAIVASNGAYCIYQPSMESETQRVLLHNLETGAETEIINDYMQGFTFTEAGLFLNLGSYDKTEIIPYP